MGTLHLAVNVFVFRRRKSFSFFLRAPYILRTTYFSGDNGGRRCQELKPHYLEKVKMACRIRIHGARGLAVGDIPPGTTRWYMGRTIRGGPTRKIKAYTTRLQVVPDIVIVPNRILYLYPSSSRLYKERQGSPSGGTIHLHLNTIHQRHRT